MPPATWHRPPDHPAELVADEIAALRADSLAAPRPRVPWRAINLLAGFGCAIAAGALASAPPDDATTAATTAAMLAVGGIIGGVALLALSVAQHECAHGTLFGSPRVNTVVGWLAGLLLLLPFGGFVRGHRAHHAWSGREKDPTPAPAHARPHRALDLLLAVRLLPVLFLVGVWWPYATYDWRPTAHRPRWRHRLLWLLDVALIVALHVALAVALGAARHAIVFGGAFLLYAVLYEQLFTQYHHVGLAPVERPGARLPLHEQLHHARSIDMPAWLAGPLLHFNRHKEHHLFPQLPWHRLPAVHAALCQRRPDVMAHTEHLLAPWRWRARRSHLLLAPTPGDSCRTRPPAATSR